MNDPLDARTQRRLHDVAGALEVGGINFAGIRPLAASTMIRPVGVGRASRGPIGVEGLTMTAGRPCSATMESTRRSAAILLRLYAPIASFSGSGVDSSAISPDRKAMVATLLV